MVKLGELNTLEVLRSTGTGFYLGSDGKEEALLPVRNAPEKLEVGGEIEVFLYKDSEDTTIASAKSPKILLHSYACLKVVSFNRMGAFFNMGIDKDLFVPEKEQNATINAGDKRIVYMFLDDRTQKLVGSMKWKDFCFKDEPEFEVNQKVKIMIGEETDLGRNVLIENAYYGLIYDNEIFEDLEIGEEREAYIKNQREDGDIDVSLQPLGYSRVLSSVDKIVELLKANEGVLEIGDKSSPELITALTGMSKKTFKKAIGDLYKKKLVVLEPKQVKLVEQ